MTFSMTVHHKPLSKDRRRTLDAKITAILGDTADDIQVDGTRVWRKYGDVEIFDDTTLKVISGKADIGTVEALCTALRHCGCTA